MLETNKMKYFLIIYVLVMFCEVYAQEPTNSAAKIYYKGILKHFEKLKTIDYIYRSIINKTSVLYYKKPLTEERQKKLSL